MVSTRNDISGIELTDTKYLVKQRLTVAKNMYDIFNSEGQQVMYAEQKMFKAHEEFPFTDPNGNHLFTVKAQHMFDFAGDYALFEEQAEQPFAVLHKQFTLAQHIWHVYDGQEQHLATVSSRGVIDALRALSNIFHLIPHKYSITAPHGEQIGEIQEQFSFKDKYWVSLYSEGMDHEAREVIIAAAIAVDALEGQ